MADDADVSAAGLPGSKELSRAANADADVNSRRDNASTVGNAYVVDDALSSSNVAPGMAPSRASTEAYKRELSFGDGLNRISVEKEAPPLVSEPCDIPAAQPQDALARSAGEPAARYGFTTVGPGTAFNAPSAATGSLQLPAGIPSRQQAPAASPAWRSMLPPAAAGAAASEALSSCSSPGSWSSRDSHMGEQFTIPACCLRRAT